MPVLFWRKLWNYIAVSFLFLRNLLVPIVKAVLLILRHSCAFLLIRYDSSILFIWPESKQSYLRQTTPLQVLPAYQLCWFIHALLSKKYTIISHFFIVFAYEWFPFIFCSCGAVLRSLFFVFSSSNTGNSIWFPIGRIVFDRGSFESAESLLLKWLSLLSTATHSFRTLFSLSISAFQS